MSEFKVDPESAELEFQRIAKARRLDTDVSKMTEKDRESFNAQKEPIIEAIMSGHLTVDDVGEPTLNLEFPVTLKTATGDKTWDKLTFYRPKGAMLTASDGFGDNDRGARMHAMLANVCKVSRPVFDEMDWYDHKVCQSLFALFLA